mmetsp:Transcript_38107/g.76375  ORF Transcript_38107/g.76375 Transcript_38107/m.76375 type:complete len:245 (-) Transcript_38107:323-1057(-)
MAHSLATRSNLASELTSSSSENATHWIGGPPRARRAARFVSCSRCSNWLMWRDCSMATSGLPCAECSASLALTDGATSTAADQLRNTRGTRGACCQREASARSRSSARAAVGRWLAIKQTTDLAMLGCSAGGAVTAGGAAGTVAAGTVAVVTSTEGGGGDCAALAGSSSSISSPTWISSSVTNDARALARRSTSTAPFSRFSLQASLTSFCRFPSLSVGAPDFSRTRAHNRSSCCTSWATERLR